MHAYTITRDPIVYVFIATALICKNFNSYWIPTSHHDIHRFHVPTRPQSEALWRLTDICVVNIACIIFMYIAEKEELNIGSSLHPGQANTVLSIRRKTLSNLSINRPRSLLLGFEKSIGDHLRDVREARYVHVSIKTSILKLYWHFKITTNINKQLLCIIDNRHISYLITII